MMMYASSSSSNVSPGTMANTACYDPLSKCIRLPSASADGGAILEGSIIEMSMDTPPFQPGKLLLGEIVEIVIMDENMQPLAVFDEKHEHRAASPAAVPTVQSPSREEFLQKQREQQQLHYQQSQVLMQQHQQEKQRLDSMHREGRIPMDSKIQLSAEMEDIHQRELMELQENHQREQAEMMDLIFESASVAMEGKGAKSGGNHKTDDQQSQPARAQTATTKQNLWNKAVVSNVAARSINQNHNAADEEEHSQTTENKAAGLWSRPAVTAVAADNINQNHSAEQSQSPAPPTTADASNTKHLEEMKQEELKAVMRDRHIPKEERIKRVTAIKAKYAAQSAAPTTPVKTHAAQHTNSDKLRREEIQSVMKDQSLGKAEKQKRLSEIKAKYASQAAAPPSIPQPSYGNQDISRWKRAGTSAFAANSFTKKYTTMKQTEGAVTPMSEFIKKVKKNDETTTIILDGRKNVSEDEWTDLFDAIEGNTHLTHLSAADCGLGDDVCVSLVLALVENETLTSLNLENNRLVTDGTGKSFLKVLKQSNPVVKCVDIDGTSISPKMSRKIQNILDDRDDTKILEKKQAARQRKIKELLAFSASDDVSPSSARLSQRLLEIEKEEDDQKDVAKLFRSGSSASSGDKSKNTKGKNHSSIRSSSSAASGDRSSSAKKKKRSPTGESRQLSQSSASVSSKHSSGSGGHHKSLPPSGSGRPRNRKSSTSTGGSGTGNHWKSVARANNAAKAMANLGVMDEVKETRKMRGECPDCGQKCINKTLFKSVPLTIPNKVLEGRCLKCTQ